MAEEQQTNEMSSTIDMDALTPKGKLHAEQYQQMQMQKIKHQLEIEEV